MSKGVLEFGMILQFLLSILLIWFDILLANLLLAVGEDEKLFADIEVAVVVVVVVGVKMGSGRRGGSSAVVLKSSSSL